MPDSKTASTAPPSLRHTEIGRLLSGAETAIAAGDWPAAAAMLTSVLHYEPDHSEAAARLAFVRSQAVRPERVRGGAHAEIHLSRGALITLGLVLVVCAAGAILLGIWAGS